MKTNKLVIPLILLIMSWINVSQALQEASLKEDYITPNQVELRLPKLAMGLTDTLTVPLDIIGLNNEDVYSIYLKIALDTTIVHVEDVVSGFLTEDWNTPIWHIVNGELRISHYGLAPITQSGNALNILMTARGEENTSTELTFALGALNEGTPQADLVAGRVFIGTPYPVISDILESEFEENNNINIPIIVTDPLDKNLVIDLSNLPEGASFTDNGDGTALINWASDYYSAGEYNMLISATNEDTLSSQVEFNLIISNIPQSPHFLTPFEDVSFNEDESLIAYNINDYIADSDLNQGDSLFVNLEVEENIFMNFQDDLISFSATENWFGSETVNLIISDTYGFEISQQIEVSVVNVNDQPIQLQALPEIEIAEDFEEYSLNLNDYFSDIDNILDYSINNSVNVDFSIAENILTLQPHLNWFGTETLELTVVEGDVINLHGAIVDGDSENLNIINNLTIVVNPVNDAPEIIAQFPEVNVLMNATSSLEDIDNFFTDVDSDLLYTFTGNNNLDIAYLDNSFQITPNVGWVGVERVTVTATDDHNLSVSQSLVIRVQAGYYVSEDFNHSGSLATGWSATGGNWLTSQDSGDDWSMEVNNPRISRTQRFISKAYDLSGIYDVEVSFHHDLLRPSGVTAIFQYSLNGFTYYNVESFEQSTTATYSIVLPEVANNSNVRFRWQYLSSTVATNYWNIDDFEINGVMGNYLPPATVQGLQLTAVSPQELTFSWSPIENNFFNQYEISVMSEESLTEQLFIWNGSDDNELYFQENSTTIITGLTLNESYYFAIRSTDMSGNVSDWSEIISATPTSLPTITFLTDSDTWFNSLTPIISVLITDDLMIDSSSLEYRIDANNNNSYDQDELWLSIDNYQNNSEIEIEIPLVLNQDAIGYSLELRCFDTQNDIYSYSGLDSEMGINDDFTFNIDTQAPALVEDLLTSNVSETSVSLDWLPSSDNNFSHYEIYYSNHYDLSIEDTMFSIESDANLNDNLTTSTIIEDLDLAQRYWFTILAVDLAGNRSELSNIVTSLLASDFALIYDVSPIQTETYLNTRQVQLACKIKDAYGVDSSTVQYRIDANGNGQYDSAEEWLNVFANDRAKSLRNNFGTMDENGDFVLEVTAQANYLTDGEELMFEFRAKDISGFGYSYSGFDSVEGITDDWSVSIDTIYPTDISNILPGLITISTAEIAWTSSQDANFIGYKIFYSENENVTNQANFVSWLDFPELADAGSGQIIFTLPNLNPNVQYFLKVAAVDIASNETFSDEISFVTNNDSKPRKPENITLTFQGNDLILSWDIVDEDTSGNPLQDVVYDIFFSENPEFELDGSNYYDTAYENQYIFYGIGDVLPMIFFKIQAYSD